MPHESRPAWAQRLTAERLARGWTQQQTTEALRMQADRELPDPSHLLRMWKNWERGKHRPRPEYQRLIAAAFGSVSAAIFGPDATSPAPSIEPAVAMPSSDSTLELVERIRRSDLDRASLDTLTITVERLCSEYAFMPSADLRREGQAWMAKLVQLLDARLTLAQHREVLVLAGWLALLVGCVEYDTKDVRAAEATRRAAASLGQEAGHSAIMAWAQEMNCWFALTQGRYRQVIEAARAGRAMAPNDAVSVQLAGQEAKAWARMGDRRQVELALERGRVLMESLPYPDNLDNHFTVDPDKFDFYAMDCHRRVGEDAMATMHAHEVIRKSTAPDGSLRSPMRAAEAHTTLAVASARAGDLDGAIEAGTAALEIPRQSLPSLLMVTGDLVTELRRRYTSEPATSDYVERIGALATNRD
ncbi:MAG TPA: helix-turn-helix transcriptional regulator [Acidimicrobiales bacterium]|nr:helix-turn-helix transcriptional regulator [Acidimicrobiales bacterium]